MGIISNELLQFKKNVEPHLNNMNSKCAEIVTAIQSIINATNSAQSSMNTYYDSSNKPTIMNSINTLNNKFTTISSSVDSSLKTFLSESSAIINDVNKLEKINKDIEDQQAIINNNPGEDNKTRRDNAQSIINSKQQEFKNIHDSAMLKLTSLKSKDDTLETEKEYSEVEGMDTSNLQFGSFGTKEYVVNGQKIKCYVYVPDYGEEITDLPVMMYMHGASMENSGESIVTYGGLGEQLANRTVTPSGIVVIPYVQNGHLYEDKAYRDALAQIPLMVADEYNGDKDRISLAGVSYGAVTAYRLVNEHPDTYSAVVTACGAEEVTDAFEGMKVINYSGQGDANNHTGKSYVRNQTDRINQIGGQAQYYEYNDQWAHTNVGTKAFKETVTDEQGNRISVIEWLFRQKKGNNKKA